MSENATELTPEERASTIGWAPKEDWRGDPNDWVDAEEFLARGERIIPILKANNRKLEERTVALERTNNQLQAQLRELNGSMGEFLTQQQEVLKERLADQRTRIMAELRQARESGDDAAIERLDDALDENREQKKALEAKQAAPQHQPAVAEPPEFVAWKERNTWFGGTAAADARRTALAMQLGTEAQAQRLSGREFFDYIDEHMKEVFSPPPSATRNKTEGGRPSGTSSAGAAPSGFSALPPEAKAACDEQEARFVGPNKVFKTKEAWRAHFVKQYEV